MSLAFGSQSVNDTSTLTCFFYKSCVIRTVQHTLTISIAIKNALIKIQFVTSTNCYMFRYRGAILREL